MTTIYIPRLIESAEQAEALPVGTVAVLWDGPHVIQHATLTSARRGPWDMDMHGYGHHLFVGWTALVPVDVEIEHIQHRASGRRKTIYITDWSHE